MSYVSRQAVAEIEREITEIEGDARTDELKRTVYDMRFLPTQSKYLDAVCSQKYHVILMPSGNKMGKTWVLGYDLACESWGYQPHDGKERKRTGYDIALLLRDYDGHAMKIYRECFLQMLPKDCVRIIARTQSGAPRVIQLVDPVNGVEGRHIHIFTHDQDPARLEAGSWQRVSVDEPCPERHWQALIRGLATTKGSCTMTMTLLEGSAWIWENIHCKAANQGGDNERYVSLVADPYENYKSRGGFLDDDALEDFRKTIPREHWDARVLGKALHLAGRVYKDFEEKVHVLRKPLHTPEEIADFPKVLAVDPHTRVPFAMAWAYVAPGDVLVFYEEWPNDNLESLQHVNFTFNDYAGVINNRPMPTFAVMDPNAGKIKSITSGLTIAQELSVLTGLGFQTDIDDTLTTGHDVVARRLRYDREKPLSTENQPSLFITPNCRNIIQSFQNYIWQEWRGKHAEGKGPNPKPEERYKHWVDCIRYACMYAGVRYFKMRKARHHVFGKARRPLWQPSLKARIETRIQRAG